MLNGRERRSIAGSALQDELLGLLGHEQMDLVCQQRVRLLCLVLVDDCLGHAPGRPDEGLVPAK